MRDSIFLALVASTLTLAGCGSTDSSKSSGTGGVTGNGGQDQSGGAGSGSGGSGGAATGSNGGVTGSGGGVGAGGASSLGGASAAGGAKQSGGNTASGGRSGTGGAIANGGAPAAGGATGSGGAKASGGTTSAGGQSGSQSGGQSGNADAALPPPPDYQGPCDVLADGCAEAYGLTRAMTAKYTGPLLQLGLSSDKSKTLDIGQTSDHKADMSKWSDFCGGKESNCVVSKIYAQIHSGANDLQPAVWKTPWNPDCSAGGYTCAAKFTIESATTLPILTTVAPQEYAIRNGNTENFATGINGGTKALGLMYNGKPVANTVYCCGVFGVTHKYDANDTAGTDFMLALAYGWKDSNGCCIAVNCGANNKYCVGAEEEENNDLYDYGSSPVENALVVTQFDPGPNAVITYLNGTQVLSHSPPKAKLNVSTAIHIGGGGDLSQPDPVLMREGLVTNSVMSASEVKAMKDNAAAFYTTLKFP